MDDPVGVDIERQQGDLGDDLRPGRGDEAVDGIKRLVGEGDGGAAGAGDRHGAAAEALDVEDIVDQADKALGVGGSHGEHRAGFCGVIVE